MTSNPIQGGAAASANPKLPLGFWIMVFIAFINAVGFTIIIPTLYPLAKQFQLTDFEASLLSTAYAGSQFLATPVLGRLSDRLGRKPLLILSLLGTVAANLLASLTPIAWPLFAARILDGLTGGNTSIAQAVVSDLTSPAQRARAFGLFGGIFRLGFVVGPALSYFAQSLPPIPGVSSLGMSFIVSAAMALLAALFTLLLLPETAQQTEPFQLRWQDFGLAKVFRAARHPNLGPIFILTFLNGGTFTIFTFAFQPFFLNVLNQDAKALAVVFAAIGILGFIAQAFLLEPLRQKLSLQRVLVTSLGLRGLIFLAIPTFPTLAGFTAIILPFGIINAFPMPIIDTLLSLRADEKQQGEALGINSSYLNISNALGPAVGGFLVGLGYQVPFWTAGALTLLTAGFSLSLKPTPQSPA
ncbi:MFS transporter [Lyngbya confervoides]|uniref:MFS transporter n=1 Tax=Lyngbya confervoides BDU141951 TaxID=1574623 RepID=A0ABD4T0R9_9CYAN|nr:MFS transporter [Lyngbya confervoides]MCM1982254.1 MFS transporter [Lyngbya confervoides BDU141951]